jgi:malonyl-CoA O-methyltransferase
MADLGAGSGSLSRALMCHQDSLSPHPLLQLDICPELLELGPAAPAHRQRWDLNRGLPAGVGSAALLASNFALQWLEAPTVQLAHWCDHLAPGGWLLLGVPTSGSYPQWRQAAQRARVPCSALELPVAAELIAVVRARGLELSHCQRLHFTRHQQGGLQTLRHLRGLGAGCGRRSPLSPIQMRRLLACWPDSTPLTWEVLTLVGRRPPCDW